jgi:hypothetical protein
VPDLLGFLLQLLHLEAEGVRRAAAVGDRGSHLSLQRFVLLVHLGVLNEGLYVRIRDAHGLGGKRLPGRAEFG